MVLKNMVRALERIERRQQMILERLKVPETTAADPADKWMEKGIDNILSYQAGKKEGK